MLDYFKKRISRNIKITVIVCAVIFIAAAAISRLDFIKLIAGPTKADMMKPMSELEGKYVSFDADYVMANYIRTETITKRNGVETGRSLTSVGYIAIVIDPAENMPAHYFGVVVPAKEDKTLEKLTDGFWDYLNGEGDIPATYHFKGSVRKVKSDEMKYWNDCINKINKTGFAEAFDMSNLEAYTVDYDKVGHSSKFLVIICLIVMILSALYCIFHVTFSMLTYDDQVKKFVAADPRRSMEKLSESFSRATKISDDMFVSPDTLFFRKGGKIKLVDLNEVVWAYVYTYKGTNYLRLYGINGKMIAAPAVAAAANAVREIDRVVPHCVCGYNAELNKMFSKNLSGFLGLKYYPAKQAQMQAAGGAQAAPSFEMDVDGSLKPVETASAQQENAPQMEAVYTPNSDDLEKDLAAMLNGGSQAAQDAVSNQADAAQEAVQSAAETAQETADKSENPYDLDFTPIDFDNDNK